MEYSVPTPTTQTLMNLIQNRLSRNHQNLNQMSLIQNRLSRNHQSLNRMSLTRSRLIRNLIQNRLSLMSLNRRWNLTLMNRSLMSPILMNPSRRSNLGLMNLNPTLTRNRLNLTPMNRSLMSRTRIPKTRLRHSQDLPNKRIEERKRGLRALEEIVNDSASLTLPLNRPVLVPIVRGGELACV
jgi:hypothetical protein